MIRLFSFSQEKMTTCEVSVIRIFTRFFWLVHPRVLCSHLTLGVHNLLRAIQYLLIHPYLWVLHIIAICLLCITFQYDFSLVKLGRICVYQDLIIPKKSLQNFESFLFCTFFHTLCTHIRVYILIVGHCGTPRGGGRWGSKSGSVNLPLPGFFLLHFFAPYVFWSAAEKGYQRGTTLQLYFNVRHKINVESLWF